MGYLESAGEEDEPARDWSIRPYRAGDEEQLISLFARVFGRPRTLESWRWKLRGRDSAFETVWVAVAKPGGRIIGHYGGIPLHVKLLDTIYPAVHAVEAMTDPDFRRQGMLTKLGTAAHTAWAEAGQVAVLGLPNDKWGTRNYALGYRRLFPLLWMRFPLHLGRVAAQPGRLRPMLAGPARAAGELLSMIWRSAYAARARNPSLNIEQISAPCPELDRLWQSAARGYGNAVVRDSAWVEWRFLRSAGYSYKVLLARNSGVPAGYIAYSLSRSPDRINGYIADLFVAPQERAVAAALVGSALQDLSAGGAGMVMTTAVPGSALYTMLLRLGFLPGRAATSFSFEIVPLARQLELAALADPGTWQLTAGDFDVI